MDNGLTRRENPGETVALLPFVYQRWHVAGEREATAATDMGVPAPMGGESGNTFLFCEEDCVWNRLL